MPHLSPTTLTTGEQRLILRATAGNVRDHTTISLALGTGLRLAEIVGLDVGDVFALDRTPVARRLRTDPDVRDYRIRLPHQVTTPKRTSGSHQA